MINPLSRAALTSFMYIVATKTLSLIADKTPFATKQNKASTKAPNKKPLNDKPKVDKKISQETKKPVKKEPAIREIVKKPKEKAKIPTRASNDPRYKS